MSHTRPLLFPVTYLLSPIPCRRGSILLYVVWIIMLLSLFAAGVGSRALFALNLSERLPEQLRAAYIARGAVQYAAQAIKQDQNPAIDSLHKKWADSPELFHEHPLAGGTFTVTADTRAGESPRYGLNDEEQRINLNIAPVDVLQSLMETVGGLTESKAQDVAASIADWRDTDSDERSGGAENYYYESRDPGYHCKDGPFENVEELLLIKGVSPELYRKVEPSVTVYGSGSVNVNTAPEAVLRALGLSTAGVAGMIAFRAGEDNRPQTTDDRQLESLAAIETTLKPYVPVEDLARLKRLATQHLLATHSEAFRMSVEATMGHASSRMRVVSILDRQGNVKLWSEQ